MLQSSAMANYKDNESLVSTNTHSMHKRTVSQIQTHQDLDKMLSQKIKKAKKLKEAEKLLVGQR